MYVSISCGDIDNWCESTDYHFEIILMRENNIRMPFWLAYNKKGNWINYDTNPHLILTEKCNVLIYQKLKNRCHRVLEKYEESIKCYNISKFLLLKQIVKNNLVNDLIKVIVNLSD